MLIAKPTKLSEDNIFRIAWQFLKQKQRELRIILRSQVEPRGYKKSPVPAKKLITLLILC